MNLTRQSDLQPAAFNAVQSRDNLQIELIIRLIKESIEKQKAITVDDIRWLHAEYACTKRRNGCGYSWFIRDGEKRFTQAYTKDEWYSGYTSPIKSINWFKANLGSAILKGRILAVPIIEI